MDALGCAIRVDARGREVMRILPRVNDAINEEWISDKTRHVWDGLRTQRLDRPYRPAQRQARARRPGTRPSAPSPRGCRGSTASASRPSPAISPPPRRCSRSSFSPTQLGSPNIDCRQDGAKLDPALGRATYLFNATIDGIDQADAILLVGTNPRLEAPVLNARILKRWRQAQGQLPIGLIGDAGRPHLSLTSYLGAGPETLAKIADGSHPFLENAQGRRAAAAHRRSGRRSRGPTAPRCWRLPPRPRSPWARSSLTLGWNGFNVLHTAAARVAGLDLGLVPGKGGRDVDAILDGAEKGEIEVVYLLGADEIDMDAARQGLRHLSGQPRRPRRAPRRRDPARRRLYREGRDLRQHRRPRADDRARRVPAGRGARGLDDPPRPVGRARPGAAVRQRRRAPRQDVRRLSASRAARPDRSRRQRRHRDARRRKAARPARSASARRSPISI